MPYCLSKAFTKHTFFVKQVQLALVRLLCVPKYELLATFNGSSMSYKAKKGLTLKREDFQNLIKDRTTHAGVPKGFW